MAASLSAVVLVVDDEVTVRSTARAILMRAGYEVHAADSGRAAIALLASLGDTVSVVLLDWTLPDIAGNVVLVETKRVAPRARVIVSTGFGREDIMRSLANGDAVTFLEKPYTAAALIAAVADQSDDSSAND